MTRMASPPPTPMKVSSTAKIRMETRAHPRRRKIPMAVQIPQPLKRANMAAITIPIAAMGNGAAAGSVGGGANAMLNSIKPPNARVARLPAIARAPLARIPIHFLAMIADQCTGLSKRGPGVGYDVAQALMPAASPLMGTLFVHHCPPKITHFSSHHLTPPYSGLGR